jgi:hypothetical protein
VGPSKGTVVYGNALVSKEVESVVS